MPVVPRPRPSPLLDVPVLGSALGFLEPGEPDVSSLINPLQAPGAIGAGFIKNLLKKVFGSGQQFDPTRRQVLKGAAALPLATRVRGLGTVLGPGTARAIPEALPSLTPLSRAVGQFEDFDDFLRMGLPGRLEVEEMGKIVAEAGGIPINLGMLGETPFVRASFPTKAGAKIVDLPFTPGEEGATAFVGTINDILESLGVGGRHLLPPTSTQQIEAGGSAVGRMFTSQWEDLVVSLGGTKEAARKFVDNPYALIRALDPGLINEIPYPRSLRNKILGGRIDSEQVFKEQMKLRKASEKAKKTKTSRRAQQEFSGESPFMMPEVLELGARGPRSLTQGILRGHPSMAEILGP